MLKLNANLNKTGGVATIIFLYLLTTTSILVHRQAKLDQQARKNFYGQDVSLSLEKKLLNNKIFYFDFNRNQVKAEYRLPLYAHARKLLQNPNLNILLTGHTDDLGSLEYNFKLGSLRGTSIADLLGSKGVDKSKIAIISYANQIPAKYISTEFKIKNREILNLDQINRRVELIYFKNINK